MISHNNQMSLSLHFHISIHEKQWRQWRFNSRKNGKRSYKQLKWQVSWSFPGIWWSIPNKSGPRNWQQGLGDPRLIHALFTLAMTPGCTMGRSQGNVLIGILGTCRLETRSTYLNIVSDQDRPLMDDGDFQQDNVPSKCSGMVWGTKSSRCWLGFRIPKFSV